MYQLIFPVVLGQMVFALAETKPSPADSSQHSVLTIQIIIAVVSSILLPIVIYVLNRSKGQADKLQEKVDSNSVALRQVEMERVKSDNAELKESVKKLIDKLEDLRRDHDRRPLDCQDKFVTSDIYRREYAAQKEYVRLLYAAIKRHLSTLEAELNNGEDN